MKRKVIRSPLSNLHTLIAIRHSPFAWLVLLLAVALTAHAVVVAHRTRVRGIPQGFPAPVSEADAPLLGVNVALEQYDEQELEDALSQIVDGGFTWVRQPFYRNQVFDKNLVSSCERIMDALTRHPDLRLIAVLDDRPAVPPDDRSTELTAGTDRFAAFAREFAARYGDQIDYYQIWDEPNLTEHWGGGSVNPRAYADLLARTAQAIRAADPDARILLAGLAPTIETGPQNLSDVRYLAQLYEAGAAPYFDVVVGKPYGFDTGPDDRRVDESVLNFSRLILLREVMVEHGDEDKAIWASHWGWNALPADWTGAPSIWGQTDEATQAARTVAALERARAEWPWVGAMVLEHFQPAVPPDDPRRGFALIAPDGTPRPVYSTVADWAAAQPDAAPVGGYAARNRWATYEDGWRVGPLGADAPRSTELVASLESGRAVFRFQGTRVALTMRRGPYRAFLYVTVDGEPANALPRDERGRAYVVLYDEHASAATVPLATGLAPGVHTVEVVAQRGGNRWPLVDWRVGALPTRDRFVWKLVGLGAAGLALVTRLIHDVRRLDWRSLRRTFLAWPEWAQTTVSVALTGTFWATSAASWGLPQSPSLPFSQSISLPVSLFLLPVLAALFTIRLDLGLALIAFAAPLYLQPGRMFYQTLSLPEVLVVLCVIACCVLRIARRKPVRTEPPTPSPAHQSTNLPIHQPTNLLPTPMDRAVALLLTAALIAGLAASDRLAALFELRAVFLLPAVYYALLRVPPLDDRARWRIVDGLVLGGVVTALVGLAQYALGQNVVLAEGGLPRLQSVYPSPNNVGLYLGRVWPILVAVALRGKRGRRRTLYAVALAPVSLALILSFSRGALLLALPASLLTMGWLAGRRYRWAALALILIGALALIPLMRLPRFASLLDLGEGSTFFRLKVWRSSLRMVADHPWLGVGPGNFQRAYRTRYVLPTAWQEFNLEHPHDIILDHWTRLGLLGVIAGATIQVAFWRGIRRRARRDALTLGLAGTMAALLAHGLVDNALFFPDLAFTFFLTLAMKVRTGGEGD